MTRSCMGFAAAIVALACQNAPATQPPSSANEAPTTVQVPEPGPETATNPEPSSDELSAARSASRTTPSGLGIEELKSGTGAVAEPGHDVSVHYQGTFTDGSVFDSSRERKVPFTFALGKGQVIKGFEEGVTGMHVGEIRRLTIPPELGYGAKSPGKIPPNSTLIFEIELLEVK